MFNVSEFRSNMVGDGARPNLFQVTLAFPTFTNGSEASQKTTFLAKTAQLPGSSVGTARLSYFGREVKFAGNRNFADWTIQIINDEDFLIRNAFERWLNGINSHKGNVRSLNAASPLDYTVDASVSQFSKAGDVIKTYKFVGMFPVDIAPIELDWGANDAIEEFSVTLAYQWWQADTTT
jgi:hypothetical protein